MQPFNSTISNSTISNSTNWHTGSLTLNVPPSVVLGLCCLVGIPGNIMVIRVIVQNYKKDNFTLKLMLNLAVSDILCLITLPVWIYSLLQGWVLGMAMCKLFTYFVYVSLYSSVFTVTLMSVQRYIQVLYTQYWAKLHGSGERVLLVTLWGLSCVLASPAIILRGIVKIDGQLQCDWKYGSDKVTVAALLIEIFVGFVIPFFILVISYYCLHKKVSQTAFFSSQRMTKLVTSIVLTFFILWTPVYATKMLKIFAVFLKSSHQDASARLQTFCDTSENFLGALSFINSSVNPFLYAFASRNICQNPPDSSGTTKEVSTSNL